MDRQQIDGLRQLAKGFVSENGDVMPFVQQMAAYEAHAVDSGDFLVVSSRADALGIPTADGKPLLMRQGIITKSFKARGIPARDIENLPEWLETHVLAFESPNRDDSIYCIAKAEDRDGNPIMVAVNMQSAKQGVEIDEITSIHGRTHLADTINKVIVAEKRIFPNTRTSDWLLHTGVQFPEQTAARLWLEVTKFTEQMQQKASKSPSIIPHQLATPAALAKNPEFKKFVAEAAEEGEHAWWQPETETLAVTRCDGNRVEIAEWRGIGPDDIAEAMDEAASARGGAEAFGEPTYSAEADAADEAALERAAYPALIYPAHEEGWVHPAETRPRELAAALMQAATDRIDLSIGAEPLPGEESESKKKTADREAEEEDREQEKSAKRAVRSGFVAKFAGGVSRIAASARQDEARASALAKGGNSIRPTRAAERNRNE